MRRIVICGSPGAGKSTLARLLAQRLGLPVLHLDALFWRPGWQPSTTGDFRHRVACAMRGHRWICDGDFAAAAGDLTLPRAEAVIVLEQSRWLCLFRVIRRVLQRRPRADLPAGCANRIDWALLADIWQYNDVRRHRMDAAIAAYGQGARLIRLRGQAEIAAFLATLR